MDLLEPVLTDAREGQVVVGNGRTVGGWHVYSSTRGGSWVADELKEPQVAHALHLRTADRDGQPGVAPTWHRSYFATHFASPDVHCSFRIEDWDESHRHGAGIGFKLGFLHQDNLTAYWIMLQMDGSAHVFKEARDGIDGKGMSGFNIASGRWTHHPGTRRHLTVRQSDDGTFQVWLDGELVLEGTDPHPYFSGQIALRLDGLDCRILSLVADTTTEEPTMPDVMTLPQVSPAGWGARQNYDSWTATAKDGVTVHYVGGTPTQTDLLASGHDACVDKLRGIERFHIDSRGWRGIGYNFCVCPHGKLFRLRGRAQAAHNPGDSDGDGVSDNVDSYGVLLLVGGDESPTPASLQMLQRVCDSVGGTTAPHSKDRATSCPGDPLRQWIDDYNEGTVTMPEQPGDWAKPAWEWGKKVRLVRDETEPHDTMTKQEFVVLMHRYDKYRRSSS